MEQNASSTGRSQLTNRHGERLHLGEYGLGVIGTLHAKANTNPPGSSSPPPPSVPAPTVRLTQKAPPNSASATYQVYGTAPTACSSGLVRAPTARPAGCPNGANVQISCQTTGSSVKRVRHLGSADRRLLRSPTTTSTRLTSAITAQGSRSASPQRRLRLRHRRPGTPRRDPHQGPTTWANTGGDIVYERSGPGTSYSKVGSLPAGAKIEIACPNDGHLGQRLRHLGHVDQRRLLSDYYTNTPNFDKYSPPLSQCEHS